MAKLVSKTYGDALFELAMEEKNLDVLFSEVQAVSQALQENEALTRLMNHPKLMKEEKTAIIKNIFDKKASNEMTGFLVLVVNKGRYMELPSIFQYFTDRVKEYRNIGTAFISSAQELNEEQKEHILARLLETTKFETIEMNYTVDESLIGGLVIRIGDRVMDSSVKTKLYEMSKDLLKIQLVS